MMDILDIAASVATIICLYLGARLIQNAHGALSAEQLVVARDINKFTTLGFIAPLGPLLIANLVMEDFPNNKLLVVAIGGAISLGVILFSVFQNLRKMKLAGLPYSYTSSLTKGILLLLFSIVIFTSAYIRMRTNAS